MNKKLSISKNKVFEEISTYNSILLFLDYDGTLAPFADNPAEAYPLPGVIELIKHLNDTEKYSISLITGRRLKDLRKFINLKDIYYAGTHGLEIITADGNELSPGKDRGLKNTDLNNIRDFFKKEYLIDPDYSLEDKGLVLTLHHPTTINKDKIIKHLETIIRKREYEILPGRKIIEIRPRFWNKGDAVKLLIQEIKEKNKIDSYLPIYIGDDSTDEDVFKILNNGIGIYVENENKINTSADYTVKNPTEVLTFLQELKALLLK
ncbi:trehalose-phosphatase [Halocella sp. SP3-1]|uniref:trehalose-phosphatase n=1 Tax=Halocella sp. SP3-1 TaxID=2382161 RepID=UPI000F75267A|nr:trehalose-phosphatase [Halocella sp. SP3-1]AZO94284.1 trehalose-phosphatase [Halocella sp. SP3-1]